MKKQCWNIYVLATLLIESSLLTNILLREMSFMILSYPYLEYPYFPSFQKICWNCGRSASETCSGCNYARYCSQFCQHKDWENHHKVCKPLPSSATAINGGHTSTSGILTPSARVTIFLTVWANWQNSLLGDRSRACKMGKNIFGETLFSFSSFFNLV